MLSAEARRGKCMPYPQSNGESLRFTRRAVKANRELCFYFCAGGPDLSACGTDRDAGVSREVAESLGDNRAVLMRGHGSTVVGPNLKQAVVTAIYLEETARLTYRARCIGAPICFTDEEVASLSDYVLAENSFNRAWDY